MRANFLRAGLWALLLASLSANPAFAVEKPADFSHGLALQADGKDALYQLELPAALYRGAADRDLADVRVFNAASEMVPYALKARATSDVKKSAPVSLRIFPIRGEAGKEQGSTIAGDSGSLSLLVQRTTAGTVIKLDEHKDKGARPRKVLGYLVDASMIDQPLRAIGLEVKSATDYTAQATIAASDDLATWTVIASNAPLVSLAHGGARLEQRRIEFPAHKSRYLRISWFGMPQDAELSSATAEYGDTRIDTERQWEAAMGHALADKPGEYSFDLRGHFPADRFRLELPQANTLAPFQLLTRNRSQDPWRPVARGIAYRLNRDGAAIVSAPIAIATNADRYWQLKVDQRGGGIGAGEPRLNLGWLPHDLVFAARGAAPFTLAFGNLEAKASAYAIESLVPGYLTGAETGVKITSVVAPLPGQVAAPSPEEKGSASILSEPVDAKKWMLWGALGAGVLALGWMAWRLLKQMNATSGPLQ